MWRAWSASGNGPLPDGATVMLQQAAQIFAHLDMQADLRAVREVLARAVEKGGSTLRDFSNAQGQAGYFQLEAMVYDRAGQPCRVCGQAVKAIRQGQRSTYYCSNCQKY